MWFRVITTAIIIVAFNLVNISNCRYLNDTKKRWNFVESSDDPHGLYGKSKRIEVKSYSPGRIVKGIDAKGNISSCCDRITVNRHWNESSAVALRCLVSGQKKELERKRKSHRCTKENRIERRDLLRSFLHSNTVRPTNFRNRDDEKVTDETQGVTEPTFEYAKADERRLEMSRVRGVDANEVATIPKNEVVARYKRAHHEVNENDKRTLETTVGGSTNGDKKMSTTNIDLNETVTLDKGQGADKMREDKISNDKRSYDRGKDDTGDEKIDADRVRLVQPTEMIESREKAFSHSTLKPLSQEKLEKLNEIFSTYGDYIVAIILKNLRDRLHRDHIFEAYQAKIAELTAENSGNTTVAVKILEDQLVDKFDSSFQVAVAKYLKSLVDGFE